jgi:hypothetical protein
MDEQSQQLMSLVAEFKLPSFPQSLAGHRIKSIALTSA